MAAGAIFADDIFGGRKYNAMILAESDGKIADKYFKSHLVPFGEYRPFGDIIPTPGQLAAGPGPRVMTLAGRGHPVFFTPAICYEIVFSDSLIAGNPDFILNITNDAWFGASSGPYQHLDMARRQAIETGLPVVRANYGGISAIIDASGRIVKSMPLGRQGILDGAIPLSHATIYRRIGLNSVMLLIVLLCALVLSIGRIQKRSSGVCFIISDEGSFRPFCHI